MICEFSYYSKLFPTFHHTIRFFNTAKLSLCFYPFWDKIFCFRFCFFALFFVVLFPAPSGTFSMERVLLSLWVLFIFCIFLVLGGEEKGGKYEFPPCPISEGFNISDLSCTLSPGVYKLPYFKATNCTYLFIYLFSDVLLSYFYSYFFKLFSFIFIIFYNFFIAHIYVGGKKPGGIFIVTDYFELGVSSSLYVQVYYSLNNINYILL